MIDLIIDYTLATLELALDNLTGIINILVTLSWVVVARKLKLAFKVSLKLSLGLLFLSMLVTFFNLSEVAGIIAEYAFIFLLVGVVQWFFSKSNSKSKS